MTTRKGTSVVAVDDTVRVEHGHNSEQKTAPQSNSDSIIAGEKINDSMHHPRRVALPGMHSRADKQTSMQDVSRRAVCNDYTMTRNIEQQTKT